MEYAESKETKLWKRFEPNISFENEQDRQGSLKAQDRQWLLNAIGRVGKTSELESSDNLV